MTAEDEDDRGLDHEPDPAYWDWSYPGNEPDHSQCNFCARRTAVPARGSIIVACAAFQAGIPPELHRNELDHREPIDGDGGFRFEPKSPEHGRAMAVLWAKIAARRRAADAGPA